MVNHSRYEVQNFSTETGIFLFSEKLILRAQKKGFRDDKISFERNFKWKINSLYLETNVVFQFKLPHSFLLANVISYVWIVFVTNLRNFRIAVLQL